MSEREMHVGRWQKPENLLRYLRAVADGKGAVVPLEEKPEEKPEEKSGRESGRRTCGSEQRNVIGLAVRHVEV